MINAPEAREDDPEFQSPVDLMFERLEEKDPDHFAVRQYKKYKLAVMDGGQCILQLRGVRPFLSQKYDITKHKRYSQLMDYDKKNAFDIETYRKSRLKLKKDEPFDYYMIETHQNS